MEFNTDKIELKYSHELIENFTIFPIKHAVPCSVLFNDLEIGGIFVTCSKEDMKYFKISPLSPPEPEIKFRMLDLRREIFVIEIWLQFSEKPKKYLKLHLNPYDKCVQKYLNLALETSLVSFHFYDSESKLLSSATTFLDDDNIAWFERNYKLSTQLNTRPPGYEKFADSLTYLFLKSDRFFNYYKKSSPKFFVGNSTKQVMFYDISKLN